MDIERLVRDTFTAHEHVAPDSDEVLAAARQRIERGRTVLTRPLAVAAGVAVLSLAAVTVVALNRPDAQQAAPVGDVRVTGSTSAGPAIPALTMPFTLGWLPPGEVDHLARRINTGATAAVPEAPLYGGEYLLTVTAAGKVLNVDVQQFRMMPLDEAAFKSGPGRPVTVDGQPAVESANPGGPGGYEVYVAHPDGGSMYVNVSAEHGATAPEQQLVETGRRIAENIHFPGTTTVTPVFGLGDLPDGVRMCTFDVGNGAGPSRDRGKPVVHYTVGTCTTMSSINIGIADADHVSGTSGRSVQGRETRHADENGYVQLWVLDAVDGDPVSLGGRVPLSRLYAIADGLVLPD